MTEFDEERFEQHLAGDPRLATRRLLVLDPQAAGALFRRRLCVSHRGRSEGANGCFGHRRHFFERAEYHFYAALARAALCDAASPRRADRSIWRLWPRITASSRYGPRTARRTFENRAALVGAEIARLEGRDLDAERLYEQAIRSARANGFVHNEALANELAARFYPARGFEKIARAYLQDARYGYLRWGADGKVRQLDELYPQLRGKSQRPLRRARSARRSNTSTSRP